MVGLGLSSESFVRHGELHHLTDGLQLVGDFGRLVAGRGECEGMGQPAVGRELEHLSGNGDFHLPVLREEIFDLRADLPVADDIGAVKVLPGELGAGDSGPELFGRGADVNDVNVLELCHCGGHRSILPLELVFE